MNKLIIYAIETDKGFFITENPSSTYSSNVSLKNYLINGKQPMKSYHDSWGFVPSKPEKITLIKTQPSINHRFVLADDSFVSEKTPLEIKREDAGEVLDCQNFRWFDKYSMYQSMYIPASDKQSDIELNVEFDLIVLLKIKELPNVPYFQYKAGKFWNSFKQEYGSTNITSSNIQHQEVDKIIFPSILLPNTPCKLSSENTYKIIRAYIQDNIDPKVAKITSDYDFCFEVVKKIQLAKPYTSERTYKPKGRRKIEIVKTFRDTRDARCFEMTHSGSNYKGYTTIKGFEGNNEADLKEQIDAYLKDLIEFINEPLKECPNCNGVGVLLNEK